MESTPFAASPAPSPSAAKPRPGASPLVRPALLRMVVLLLLFSVPGLLAAFQAWFYALAKDPASPLSRPLLANVPPWWYWALATPIILALGRRFRLERDTWTRALRVHIPASIGLVLPHLLLIVLVMRVTNEKWFVDNSLGFILPLMLAKYGVTDLIIYGGILSVGYAVEYHRRYVEGALTQSQLETRLAHAQLDTLRAQLHPHFLFNTLNAISVLVRKQDTAGSIRMLTGVSELLRMALHTTDRQQVPLHEDLDFLERYLDIEQTRFQDRLQVVNRIDPTTLGALVPSLILQPLVENAIKHGLATRSGAGRVELRAAREGDLLVLEVLDDGPGLAPDWASRGGIGVANVRARLRQLHGERCVFTLVNREGGGALARLELPFQPAPREGGAA
ncbi:histidine kinase [Myxococcus stipitatus]|uniref:sensor histidine kinase n=1 Tax=Myxococcus stipitatus TaxID=83455 RepID=UPI001F260C67|nr:histidine kinase [Myxococcus stipitatus]MCE9669642.1 histidine kinase [Myxococcus stipitatus]